jgi:hypothetical protein
VRPYVRYLRIGWTVFCGIVAVLLCVLWLAGFLGGYELLIHPFTDRVLWMASGPWHFVVSYFPMPGSDADGESTGFRLPIIGEGMYGRGLLHFAIPYWFLLLVINFVAVVPWLPFKRFSLRTLLIATTLIALIMGLVLCHSLILG